MDSWPQWVIQRTNKMATSAAEVWPWNRSSLWASSSSSRRHIASTKTVNRSSKEDVRWWQWYTNIRYFWTRYKWDTRWTTNENLRLLINSSKELSKAQQTETYCQSTEKTVEPNALFTMIEDRLVCRKASIDEYVQDVIPNTYWSATFFKSYNSVLAYYRGIRWMCNKLRR